MRKPLLLLSLCFLLLLIGCGGGEKSQASPDYKETKTMVLDILKTDEGKKAIQEASKEGEKKKEDTAQIHSSVEKTLIDPKNQEGFKEMLKDPKVAKAFAKAIEDEHKKLMKDLMKDPAYQQMMIKIMNDPKYQEILLKSMNSTTYQQQTMGVMKEAMQSPMFRLEMIQLMVEAQKEMMKPESQEKKKKEEGGGSEGGGGGSK